MCVILTFSLTVERSFHFLVLAHPLVVADGPSADSHGLLPVDPLQTFMGFFFVDACFSRNIYFVSFVGQKRPSHIISLVPE
jgi:hypothetical protein